MNSKKIMAGLCILAAFCFSISSLLTVPAQAQTEAAITLNAATLNVTYDGNPRVVTATTDPPGLEYLVTYNGSETAPIDAGEYEITATIDTESGYTGSAAGTLVIHKADAVINVSGYTGVYDGNAHGASGTARGINDEDLSGLLAITGTFTNVPGGTAEWSFAGSENYNEADGTVDIIISKATADVTLDPASLNVVYDGSPKSAVAIVTPEDLTCSITYEGSETAPIDAGEYAVEADVTENNYTGSGSGTLIIEPKALTITGLTVEDKVYDGNNTATLNFGSASLTGVVEGDDVSFDPDNYTAAFASADVGKDIEIVVTSLALSGPDADNYTLTLPTGLSADINNPTTPDTGSGGGGGEGGGTGRSNTGSPVVIEGFSRQGDLLVNKHGESLYDVILTSGDGQVILTVPAGTVMLDSKQKPIKRISSGAVTGAITQNPEEILISAYELGPAGVQFSPSLRLIMRYDPAAWPEGVPEQSVYLGFWDGTEWAPLESQVDIQSNSISAQINGASQYALIGKYIQDSPTPTADVPTPAIPTATLTPAIQETYQPELISTPSPQAETSPEPSEAQIQNAGISVPVMVLIYVGAFILAAGLTAGFIWRRSRSRN